MHRRVETGRPQHPRPPEHGGQRGPELVRQRGEKFVFETAGLPFALERFGDAVEHFVEGPHHHADFIVRSRGCPERVIAGLGDGVCGVGELQQGRGNGLLDACADQERGARGEQQQNEYGYTGHSDPVIHVAELATDVQRAHPITTDRHGRHDVEGSPAV